MPNGFKSQKLIQVLLAVLFLFFYSQTPAKASDFPWSKSSWLRSCQIWLSGAQRDFQISQIDWNTSNYLSSGVFSVSDKNGVRWVIRYPMLGVNTRFEKFASEFIQASPTIGRPPIELLNLTDRDKVSAGLREAFQKLRIRLDHREFSNEDRGPISVTKFVEGSIGEKVLSDAIEQSNFAFVKAARNQGLSAKTLKLEIQNTLGPLAHHLADLWVLQYVVGIHDLHESNWVLTEDQEIVPIDLAHWSDARLNFEVEEMIRGFDSDNVSSPWYRAYSKLATQQLMSYLQSLDQKSIMELAQKTEFYDFTDVHAARMLSRLRDVLAWRETAED